MMNNGGFLIMINNGGFLIAMNHDASLIMMHDGLNQNGYVSVNKVARIVLRPTRR